jgi:SpoVK/Ycf46/Vps4 family AAA+-type ATPase
MDQKNFSDLKNFALKNKKKFPNFHKTLNDFQNGLIGFESAKNTIYTKLKSIIMLEIGDSHRINTRSKSKKRKIRVKSSGGKKQAKRDALKNIFQQIILEKLNENNAEEYDEDDDEDYSDEDNSDDENDEEDEEQIHKTSCALHLCIVGESGVGKTFFAEKVYNLYASLNLVSRNKFAVVTRGDLIGQYQGWSSKTTRNLINKYKNGVIFIDEAYSLVNSSRDSFGSEALTEIIEAMSNESKNVTFFFAGYKQEMLNTLFKSNQGLERRIPTIIELEKPRASDLFKIFVQNVRDVKNLKISKNELNKIEKLFEKEYKIFNKHAGDVVLFIQFVKDCAISRMWDLEKRAFNIIEDDVVDAFVAFKKHKMVNNNAENEVNYSMYI